MNDTEPLEMILDEMIHRHGIRSVLEALAIACDFEDDQALEGWEGPEGAFDPAWKRLATKLHRIARSRDLPEDDDAA